MRLRLRPGLHRVRREPCTVQIGLGDHACVIDGLTGDDLHLLEDLDAEVGVEVDTVETVHPERPRALELIRLLAEADLLVPADDGGPGCPSAVPGRPAPPGAIHPRLLPDAEAWTLTHPRCSDGRRLVTARAARHVLVQGQGRVAWTIAAALASAGVSVRVECVDGPVTDADVTALGTLETDVGRPRTRMAEDLVRRVSCLSPATRPPEAPWDLVVPVDHAAADSPSADRWLVGDIPHLSVVVRETDVVVGPLVIPGATPCLRCLDLHRAEADPGWGRVLAQLVGGSRRGRVPAQESLLAVLAAHVAALQVLALIDGHARPAALGATLEVRLPQGLVRRRRWPAHPECGCRWPPSARVGSPPVTMAP